jgi:A/G-specific adenine glycosylase
MRGATTEAKDARTVWAPLSRIDSFGVPAPVRKLLDALTGTLL